MTLSGEAIENALYGIRKIANCPILKSVIQFPAYWASKDPGPEPAEPLLDRKTISLLVYTIFMPDFEHTKW